MYVHLMSDCSTSNRGKRDQGKLQRLADEGGACLAHALQYRLTIPTGAIDPLQPTLSTPDEEVIAP